MQRNPTVLDLAGLRLEAHPRPSYFERWFNCRIAVKAHPFAGVLETLFTDEHLTEFADTLDRLDPAGEAILGGDRAAELRLVVEPQFGGAEGALAVECTLTPHGNEPLNADPLADPRGAILRRQRCTTHLRALAAIQPWPAP